MQRLTVTANSTNAGNNTLGSSLLSSYKELPSIAAAGTIPITLSSGTNITTSWNCSVGNYRIASLNLGVNTSSNIVPFRVETYNGTSFVDVLHSYYANTTGLIRTVRTAVLAKQINANETGSCTARITNLGSSNFTVTSASLETYYNETVSVRDIVASVRNANTTGFETTEPMFNVSALISNSINENYIANVTLHIANSSGEFYSANSTNVNLSALSTVRTSFLNINASNWTAGIYTLNVTLTGNFTTAAERSENLYLKDVAIYASTIDYMCNQTTETFEVTLYSPFTDTINYNVSLEMPSGC